MRIAFSAVFVSDIERAKAFYRDTLGLKVVKEIPQAATVVFDADGTHLVIHTPSQKNLHKAQIGRSSGIIFQVPSVRQAHEELSAKGVQFTKVPEATPNPDRQDDATFLDPDGNEFGLTDRSEF
mgnify:CR=1 FL=1